MTKPSIKDDERENKQHRETAARKAKVEGFIKLIDLESILATDDSYPAETLRDLDSIFKPGAPEPKNLKLQEYRHAFWLFLLLRWTGLHGQATKIMLPDIGKYLSSYLFSRESGNYEPIEIRSATSEYFDKAYISLAELSAYFKNIELVHQICLPMPILLRDDIEAFERHHKMLKKITGTKVIERLNISPSELLDLIKNGLPAYTSGGDRVFNIDMEPINNRASPSKEDLIFAEHRYAINEMRKSRGQEAGDISEFPSGWYGISFSPPQNYEVRQSYFDMVLSLYFALDDIEKCAPLFEGSAPSTSIKKIPKGQDVTMHENAGNGIFPVLPETKWSEISITVIDDERARIKTPIDEKLFHRSQLGMENKISGKSTLLWAAFCLLAEFNGRVDSTNPRLKKNVIDSFKRLNKKLKGIFDIKENAWDHYKKNKAYVTKFRIEDKREKEIS